MNCWIARNRNGFLLLFDNKPTKDEGLGEWNIDNGCYTSLPMEWWTKSISWEDSEPVEAVIVLKRNLMDLNGDVGSEG